MKLKIYKILLIIFCSLILIITSLLFIKYINRYKNEKDNKSILEELSAIIPLEEESTQINGYNIIGKIKISKINIEYPILDINEYSPSLMKEPLKTSIVKYWGSKVNENGNLSIAGHNNFDGTMFGKLKKLERGDIVELEDLKKEKVNYKVYNISIVDPNNIKILEEKNKEYRELTMITCTNGNKNRLIVKAREIKKK